MSSAGRIGPEGHYLPALTNIYSEPGYNKPNLISIIIKSHKCIIQNDHVTTYIQPGFY